MGGSIYTPLIDSMRWSYSRIKLFDTCEYAWYLKYLYGEDEAPNFYASYGSYMHRLIEKYYTEKKSRQELALSFLMGFSHNVDGRRPQESTVEKYIDAGYEYLSNIEPIKYDMVSVEEPVRFSLGGIEFIGIIDYLGTDGDDLCVVDHKSRDLRQRSKRSKPTKTDEELDSYLRQLYLYSAGVEQKYGVLPKKLCFNCFKCGRFIEEPFNTAAYEEAKLWAVDSVKYIKRTTRFRPNLDWFYCTNLCGFHNVCCYYNDMMSGDYH